MKIDSFGVSEPADSKAAKLIPQQQKLDWERQWLNENKNAFEVIKNGDQSASSGRYDFDAHGNKALLTEVVGQKPDIKATDSVKNVFPDATGAIDEKLIGETRFVQVGNNVFGTGTSSQLVSRRNVPAAASMLNADIEELYKRPELKQSAVWRDGKKAAASMRLPVDSQEDQAIVTTLRQWLADAGLKLVSLIVNGKIRWKL